MAIIHTRSVTVCLCVCVWRYMYHPCHLHVHEWRIWMLLPTQETLIHLSTKTRYTHTYMHTHTQAQMKHHIHDHHTIHHSIPPISCFPHHKLIRPMTVPWQSQTLLNLNDVSSIMLSFILSSIHPSFFSFVYCSFCSSTILQAASDPEDTWMSDSWQEALWQLQVRHVL